MDDTKEKPNLMRVNDTLYIDQRGRQFSVGTAEVTEATRDNRIYIPMHVDDVAELEKRRAEDGARKDPDLGKSGSQTAPDPKKSAGNQSTSNQEAGARHGGEPQNGQDQGPSSDKPNNA